MKKIWNFIYPPVKHAHRAAGNHAQISLEIGLKQSVFLRILWHNYMWELLQYRAVHHSQKECVMQLNMFGWRIVDRKKSARKDWRPRVDELLEKYDHTCHWCKRKVDRRVLWIEHFVPISRGGADEWENLRVAHRWCNRIRGNLMPDDPRIPALIASVEKQADEAIVEGKGGYRKCLAPNCFVDVSPKGLGARKCDDCVLENQRAKTREFQKTPEGQESVRNAKRKYRSNPFNGEHKKRKAMRTRRNTPRKQ